MLEELALTILHRHDSVAFPHTHAQLAYKHTLTLLCVCVNVYRINACMRVCMMCVRMHLRYVHQQRSAQNIVSWRLLFTRIEEIIPCKIKITIFLLFYLSVAKYSFRCADAFRYLQMYMYTYTHTHVEELFTHAHMSMYMCIYT